MDPSQWGNLSGLGRLTTPGVPMPSVSNAGLGHYTDLSLLDSTYSTAASLAGALSPQLPLANSRIPSLSPGNFGHPLPTFLDTVANSLAHPVNHSAYKSIPVAQSDVGLDSGLHGLSSMPKTGFHEQELHRSAQSVADAVRAWENRSFSSHASLADSLSLSSAGSFSHGLTSTALPGSRVADTNLLSSSGDLRLSQRSQPSPPEPPPAHSTPSHRASAIHRNPYQTEFLPSRHVATNPSPPTYLPQGTSSQLETLLMQQRKAAPVNEPAGRPPTAHQHAQSLSQPSLSTCSTPEPARQPVQLQQQSQYTPPVENIQFQEEMSQSTQQQYGTPPPQMPPLVPLNEPQYTGSPQMSQQPSKQPYGGSPQMSSQQSKHQYGGSPQMPTQPAKQQPYGGSPQMPTQPVKQQPYGGSPQMPQSKQQYSESQMLPKQQYSDSPQITSQTSKQRYADSPQVAAQPAKQHYGGSPQMPSQPKQQYGGSPQMPTQLPKQQFPEAHQYGDSQQVPSRRSKQQYGESPQVTTHQSKQKYGDSQQMSSQQGKQSYANSPPMAPQNKQQYAESPQMPAVVHQARKSSNHRYSDSPGQIIQHHPVDNNSPMAQSQQQANQYSSFNIPPVSYTTAASSNFGSTSLQSNMSFSSVNLDSNTAPTTVLDVQCYGGSTGVSQPTSQPVEELHQPGMTDFMSHEMPGQQPLTDGDYQTSPGVMEGNQMAMAQVEQSPSDSLAAMTSEMSSDLMIASTPIQAIADSTTGRKKARARKKKKDQLILGDFKDTVGGDTGMPMHQYTTIDATAMPLLKDSDVQQTRIDPYMSGPMQQGENPMMGNKYTDISSKVTTEDVVFPPGYQPGQEAMTEQTPSDKVFMTNFSGNAFDAPPNEEPPSVMGSEMVMDSGHLPPPRTKAQQKQRPETHITDNFQTQSGRPKLHPDRRSGKGKGPKSAANTGAAEIYSDPVPSSSLPKPATGQNTFMNSFLSFLQGQKGETLSSVTNSALTERPPMPKYVPDPRPRRVVAKTDLSGDVPILLSGAAKKARRSRKASVTSMDFSDDEEDSQSAGSSGLNSAVANVLSNLSDDSKGETASSVGGDEPPALEVRQKPPQETKRPRLKHSIVKKKGKFRYKHLGDSPAPAADDSLAAKSAGTDLPPEVVLREKSSRRAKEKVAEKMSKQKTKRQRKGGKVYADDDFTSEDDFMAVSSEEEKAYDSDKDPAWTPFAPDPVAVRKPESDSEDDGKGRKKKGRRSLSSKSGRGRKRINYCEEDAVDATPNVTVMASPEDVSASIKPIKGLPTGFRKGAFVIEKRFTDSTTDHPIWKIDAGKLLQKFEPTLHLGEKCHKAMCTYSSWTEEIESHYLLIKVSMQDKDVVKMHPLEKKSAELQEKYLPKFNVFMQILVSQALEPGFLTAIQEEGDEYYIEPLNTIDNLIDERKAKLLDTAGWNGNFLEQVECYPTISMIDMRGLTAEDLCQGSMETDVRAEKLVRLSGQPYDSNTLEPQGGERTQEFAISEKVANDLPSIHSLHHLKYNLFQQCSEKLKSLREGGSCADDSEVLDQCLQNRDWVLELFTQLEDLLEENKTES